MTALSRSIGVVSLCAIAACGQTPPSGGTTAAALDVLGKHAVVWSRHNGTYVLVAERGLPDIDTLARHMQRATE